MNSVAAATGNELVYTEPSRTLLEFSASLPARDMAAIERSLTTTSTATYNIARNCVYCRPVGRDNGKQQFAIGPGVRFAELAHEAYGDLIVEGDIVERTNTYLVAKVRCFDIRKRNMTFGRCRKSIQTRSGTRYSETQIALVESAALAIARRDAILQQTRFQVDAVMNHVKNRIINEFSPKGETPTLGKAWLELKARYAEIGVSEKQMVAVMESETDKKDGLVKLIGILNAINDGSVKAADAFGPINEPAGKEKKRRGASPNFKDEDVVEAETANEPKIERTPQQIYNTEIVAAKQVVDPADLKSIVEETWREIGVEPEQSTDEQLLAAAKAINIKVNRLADKGAE